MTRVSKLPKSIRDFGAKGDGVTDDAAALEAAYRSGEKIYVPPGVYRVLRSIDLKKKKK